MLSAARKFAPIHFARCTAEALVSGRGCDLRMAVYDFELAGAFECAALVRLFSDDLLAYGPPSLRARLFKFKMARRWAEFTKRRSA